MTIRRGTAEFPMHPYIDEERERATMSETESRERAGKSVNRVIAAYTLGVQLTRAKIAKRIRQSVSNRSDVGIPKFAVRLADAIKKGELG